MTTSKSFDLKKWFKKWIFGFLEMPPFCYIQKSKNKKLWWGLLIGVYVIFTYVILNKVFAVNELAGAVKDVSHTYLDLSPLNTLNNITSSIIKTASSSISGISEQIIAPLGASFVILWFLIDLTDGALTQGNNVDNLAKKFIFLALAIALINNANILTKNVPVICNDLTKEIESSLNVNSVENTKIIQMTDKAINKVVTLPDDPFSDIGNFLTCTFFSFLMLLIVGLLLVIAYIIGLLIFTVKAVSLVEMVVRGAMAPIGMSEMSRGLNSSCVRYIKKYIACGLNVSVITLEVAVGRAIGNAVLGKIFNATGLTQDVVNGDTPLIFFKLIMAMASVMIVYILIYTVAQKSQQISNDVLGV